MCFTSTFLTSKVSVLWTNCYKLFTGSRFVRRSTTDRYVHTPIRLDTLISIRLFMQFVIHLTGLTIPRKIQLTSLPDQTSLWHSIFLTLVYFLGWHGLLFFTSQESQRRPHHICPLKTLLRDSEVVHRDLNSLCVHGGPPLL